MMINGCARALALHVCVHTRMCLFPMQVHSLSQINSIPRPPTQTFIHHHSSTPPPIHVQVLGWADAGVDPLAFPTAPIHAIAKALSAAGIAQADVDYWEINEAFSAAHVAMCQQMGLDTQRVNVFGGSGDPTNRGQL